jgi:DNA-directed RNA polymerase subunit N (RpoN/RPB10)
MNNLAHKYDTLGRLAILAEKVLLNYVRIKYNLIFLNSPLAISCTLLIVAILQLTAIPEKYSHGLSITTCILAAIAVFLDLRSNTRLQYKDALKKLDDLKSNLQTLYREIERKESNTDFQKYERRIQERENNANEIINELSFQLITVRYAKRRMKKESDFNWIDEAMSDIRFFREQNRNNS